MFYITDKHTLFYKAYHTLRDHYPDLKLSIDTADELDRLIWSALGHHEPFNLGKTSELSEHDCACLRMLSGPHGLTIFKIMLARREGLEVVVDSTPSQEIPVTALMRKRFWSLF